MCQDYIKWAFSCGCVMEEDEFRPPYEMCEIANRARVSCREKTQAAYVDDWMCTKCHSILYMRMFVLWLVMPATVQKGTEKALQALLARFIRRQGNEYDDEYYANPHLFKKGWITIIAGEADHFVRKQGLLARQGKQHESTVLRVTNLPPIGKTAQIEVSDGWTPVAAPPFT